MDTTAVILAVASPPGRSPRGIVRASGAGTFDLLAPHVEFPRSRGVHRSRLRVASFEAACLVLVMPAPGSYTGQDSAEIQLPGNPWLLERVIDALIASGRGRGMDARRAEPGEFTARAFLGGRLSLTEAEGVAATITARSDAELRAAGLLTGGRLGGLARGLADELTAALALVEAGIDFTDQEDVVAIAPPDLGARIRSLRRRVDEHLRRAVGTEQLESIPWVVLAGPPNAGKSTLFNALLGRTRAVVSHDPGTTRDVLAEPLAVGIRGAEVMLADLAGADDDPSRMNLAMQAAARAARDRAELVIECAPVDAPRPPVAAAADRLVARTKCDLGPAAEGLPVSALDGTGLDALRAEIAERLGTRAVSLAADALALRPRHEAALRSARDELDRALELVEPAAEERHLPDPELVAACLRSALNELAVLVGDVTPDDVLGRIFGEFCVGK